MEINLTQILFQIINFSILLYLLRKFLYRPILKILEQRSQKIHEGLEAAEKSIQEREKIEKEEKKIMVDAEKNATKILEGARLRAKKLEDQLIQKAEEEIQEKLKRTESHAKTRRNQMIENLEKKFARSVINTTESLLKDTLTKNDQKLILDRQISKLKKVKFRS